MMLTVVTGPPCSGKSTYIGARAGADDIVIDLDRIALALAAEGTESHDYPDHVRTVARRARVAAIDAALGYSRRFGVWIIEAAPSPGAVKFYIRRGARIVTCSASPEELAERAAKRPERNRELMRSLGVIP